MIPTIIILAHALVIWMLCGATMAVGRAAFGLDAALWIHALAAPVWAAVVSRHYFRKHAWTAPFPTALIFLGFVAAADAGFVAPVFEKSYAMFRSIIGTWVPFLLIFLSTFLMGWIQRRRTLRASSPVTTPPGIPGR